jgi:RNA polymerase sigma-70 factor (ECF subfamily)
LSEEDDLLERLRAGDEAAFDELVRMWTPSLLRLARMYVPSQAVAEEVVQETWLGVLNGLDRFEGRSSLKTWVFRILVNRARTRGEREHRTIPFASLAAREADEGDSAVDPDRFINDARAGQPGAWATPPRRWETDPERALLSGETLELAREAIATLPEAQRTVITLRDLEGWTAEEARNALEISETNQRVLLHRARSKVRAALEEHLSP